MTDVFTLLAQARLLPDLDAHAPMPAWWGVLSFLLVVSFAVHLVFMNIALGSGVLLVIGRFARQADGLLAWLRGEVGHNLPVIVSLTITTGVAPLLFVQTLYPQFFYSAAILIGRFWLLILAFLAVGFYAVYLYSRAEAAGAIGAPLWRFLLALVAAGSFLSIAYIFTNHAVSVVEPRRWDALLGGARSLNTGSPQVWPRLLHTFVGATAVTGLYLACVGQAARAKHGLLERGRQATRVGMKLAMGATFVQILVGIWFLLAVDAGPRQHLYNPAVGGAGSVAWMLGIAVAIVGMWLMLRAWLEPDVVRWTLGACGAIFLTLVGMSAGRETLRLGYLAPYLAAEAFPPPQWQPSWQTASIVSFVVIALLGAAAVWLVVRWWWRLPPAPPEPAVPVEGAP